MAPRTQPKLHLFLNVFWGHWKIGKLTPKAPKKHQSSGSKFTKNEFGSKLIFAILPMRKPRIPMPKTRNFDTEINQKTFWDQARNKMKFRASWIQKTPINRFQNHPKIDENPTPDHFVSILLLSWASKVVPRLQNGPQGATEVPKWLPGISKSRHHAPQMATSRG